MFKLIKALIIEEEAQGMTEYILVVSLIALSLVWIDSGFKTAIESFYENMKKGVTPMMYVPPFMTNGGQWP
ncbi:MAG: Flp family type IVb pilin [Elusimicrobiota bacterium]